MNPILTIDISSGDWKNCHFTISGIQNNSASGVRVSFENATLLADATIIGENSDGHFLYLGPEVTTASGTIDLTHSRLSAYTAISLYANIEQKEQSDYKLVQIIPLQLSIPKQLPMNSAYAISVQPSFVEYGDNFGVFISGSPNTKVWVSVNGKEYPVSTDNSGKGSIRLTSSDISDNVPVSQQLRVTISDETTQTYDADVVIVILPQTTLKAATTAASIIHSTLDVDVPVDTDKQFFPFAGTPELEGCGSQTEATITSNSLLSSSTTVTQPAIFPRINGFSVAKLSNDAALVAISAQNTFDPSVAFTDQDEVDRVRASVVHVLYTSASVAYAVPVRRATVIDITPDYQDCPVGFTIIVDADIASDSKLSHLWAIDATEHFQGLPVADEFHNKPVGALFKIVKQAEFNRWVIQPSDQNLNLTIAVGECFTFIAYGGLACTHKYPLGLNLIQPLPPIMDGPQVVSSANPQIASNWYDAPSSEKYGYVVAEANVGSTQLFFYSFNLDDGSVFGWKQLTFNGENKNAKIAMDKFGNLHMVWESSRCQAGQVYYGVLGPASRSLMNEAFASITDKSAFLTLMVDSANAQITGLLTVDNAIALDTRPIVGTSRSGSMWASYTYGTSSCTITDNFNITVGGNPKSAKFAAFASLTHDEYEVPLDTSFQQFSYQLSFDLAITSGITSRTRDELLDLYISWKSGYTPIYNVGPTDVNVYSGTNSNRYTLSPLEYVYDQIIPIAGSYKAPGLLNTATDQLKLRHYMIAIVPERARFLASNVETSAQYATRIGSSTNYTQSQQTEYYTGNVRLALVTETSANISDVRMASQRYHVVKMIGEPFDITTKHNYKFAVHYSKLREEAIDSRIITDTINSSNQDVRFTANILMLVDNKLAGAENFIPDFSDTYQQFDIAVGCPILGEYYPSNIRPYDGTLNLDLSVTLAYSNIAIGPHTAIANPYLTAFWKYDRDVTRMYIPSTGDNLTSRAAWEETALLGSGDFPGAPSPLQSVSTDGGFANGEAVLVKWTVSVAPDIMGYNVYRSVVNSLGNENSLIFLGFTANTSYADYTATAGVVYIYYVSAIDRYGMEGSTTHVPGERRSLLTNVLPPSNLQATVDDSFQPVIAWDDALVPDDVICGWKIDYDTSGHSIAFAHTLETSWNDVNFTDFTNTLSTNNVFYYAVSAQCGNYISSPSYIAVRYPPAQLTEQRISTYRLTLGLHCNGRLSQLPITLEGRNTAPSLALDNCGKPHIACQSNRDGKWEIYYLAVLDPSLPFRFDTRITKISNQCLMPAIAVDNGGKRLIAWQDNRSGSYQIYIARTHTGIDCDRGACLRQQLTTQDYPVEPHFEYEGPYLLGEYDYEYGMIRPYGETCKVRFSFQNSGASANYHFIANFYLDEQKTSLYKSIDSRMNIGGWFNSSGMLPYNGMTVATGQVAEAWYEIASEDELAGQVYYVEIALDNGKSTTTLSEIISFYCPVEQMSRCSVPCVYTNSTGSSHSLHFRVTVYTDSTRSQSVMSASSVADQRRWVRSGSLYPSAGVTVNAGETVNVLYDPEFLPEDLVAIQNSSTINALLCNTTYFVVVESNISSVYSEIDAFSLFCGCSNFETPAWQQDTHSSEWLCSGQGGMDLRLTMTNSHTLFPSASGSQDGMIYIVWEDHRTSTVDRIAPTAYYAMWDAREDALYSSAQGYPDTRISDDDGVYRPIAVVNNMQHIAGFFTDGVSIFSKVCSLYRNPLATPTANDVLADRMLQYVFPQNTLDYNSAVASNCFSINVLADDIVRQYHLNSDTPVAMVDTCKVRFEIMSPPSAFAVRFRNDGQSEFSDWISIQPPYPQASSSSSSPMLVRDYLQAYFSADNRVIAQWILSPNSGTKTVDCQVMTLFGMAPTVSLQIVARYKELKYSVSLFHDQNFTIPATEYNGYPVVSTNAIQLDAAILNTLTATIDNSITNQNTIYVRVVFEDPHYLDELLTMAQLDGFNSGNSLTFDVVLPGITLTDNVLTKATETSLSFNYSNPASSITSGVLPGTYTGSFQIKRSDNFDYLDGLGVLQVNVPSSCFSGTSAPTCNRLRKTVTDIQQDRANSVTALSVDLERFRQTYSPEIACTFMSCGSGTEIVDPCELDNTGCVQCAEFNWTAALLGEPCFFVRSAENYPTWVQYSPVFEFDFSDSRIDYLTFGTDTTFEDILVMIKPGEEIGVTTTETTCPQPGSVPCEGSTFATMTRSVTFDVPGSSLFVYHNYEYEVIYYIHGASGCNYPSAEKVFRVYGQTLNTIPQGSTALDGMDSSTGAATWNITASEGKKYALTLHLPTPGHDGCLITNLLKGISKAELQMLGFIGANGHLRFKLAYIRSGVGFANIRGMTCAALCDEYQ